MYKNIFKYDDMKRREHMAVRNAVGKDVSIIAITAYDCPDTEEKVAAAGATAFLSKPVFRSELAKVLKACI